MSEKAKYKKTFYLESRLICYFYFFLIITLKVTKDTFDSTHFVKVLEATSAYNRD